MQLHYEKIDKDVYILDNFFSISEFIPLSEELHGMYHTLARKREDYEKESKPYWLSLGKTPTRGGVGDNMVFLSHTAKIRWAINKILKPDFPYELRRVNTNLQWMFQESSFHFDSYLNNGTKHWSWTFLAFTQTNWNTQWGGEFICQVGKTKYHNISYIPNRCVLFNGDCAHRGSAPNVFADDFRSSVAWTFASVDAHIKPNATSYIS